MYLTLFVNLFPQQALAETRTIITRGHAVLPDDEYALLEAYCADPQCHCRRVMLNVVGRRQGPDFLASIGYAFDRDDDFPGPALDPLNRQGRYAAALLDLVAQVLADPAYVARLEAHYRQVKEAADNPRQPVRRYLDRSAPVDRPRPGRRSGRKGRRR